LGPDSTRGAPLEAARQRAFFVSAALLVAAKCSFYTEGSLHTKCSFHVAAKCSFHAKCCAACGCQVQLSCRGQLRDPLVTCADTGLLPLCERAPLDYWCVCVYTSGSWQLASSCLFPVPESQWPAVYAQACVSGNLHMSGTKPLGSRPNTNMSAKVGCVHLGACRSATTPLRGCRARCCTTCGMGQPCCLRSWA